jgi:hypothetical protein
MPHLDGLALAMIVIGLVCAIALPFATHANVRLNLPPPRTPFGKGAAYVADEAISCVFILGGIDRLLGASPLSEPLDEIQVFALIIFAMATIGGAFADNTLPVEDDDTKEHDER